MQQERVLLNRVTYINFLNACAKVGDADQADGVLHDLQRASIQWDHVSCPSLLGGYTKVSRSCSLINETTYGSVINACAYAAKVQQAECRFGKILKQRVTLEEKKYCCLLNAFAYKV